MSTHSIQFRDLIIEEDDDYILINKPPFISTLKDRNDPRNLLTMAREYWPGAQAGHRLDKDTSGVMAIAKHPEAYRHLSLQFEHRQVGKIYHAVVDGSHDFRAKEVDLAILKLDEGYVRISKEGKPAQTTFTTLAIYRMHTLVECRPKTGRMHQIRIHLHSLGASITGDEQYGGKPFLLSTVKRKFKLKKDTEEIPFMKRMALHARALEFTDLKGEVKRVEAPYPKDFNALITQLERNK